MRRSVIFGCLSLAVLMASGTAWGEFGGLTGALTGGGGSSGGSLKASAQQFAKYMSGGTYHMANSVAKMEEAVGHADAAKALTAQAENMKQQGASASADDYKKTFALQDQSNIDRTQLAKVPEAKGKVLLTQSSVQLGVGAAMDSKAIMLARDLLSKKPSASDLLDGSVSSAIGLAQLAVDVLPAHVEKASTWSGHLSDYFSSHKVTPPSAEERKKVAAEDIGADEANSMFGK